MDYRIESYSQKWAKAFFSLVTGSARVSSSEAFPGLIRYRDCPRCSVEDDIFLAFQGKKLLGYAALVVEEDISRVIGDIFVFPRFRRNKIGTGLLTHVRDRTGGLAVKKIHIPVYDDNSSGQLFLRKRGLNPVKHYVEMETQQLDWSVRDFRSFEIKGYSEDEIDSLMDIQNRVFNGSWGFNPNSMEDIVFYKNMMGNNWNDILRLKIEEQDAGYIWTCPPGNDRIARIHMCGLLEKYRGKGLSKAVMAAGLTHLARKGAKTVRLTVDADNQPAVKLYQSMGFAPARRLVWYEEEIGSS